ncbi:hypothetical protein [Nostoc sp.]|uniref:hypothetical protein n=1 Tax=Nostoc sp. TaxID=1180 RepID=UPI002FFBE29C
MYRFNRRSLSCLIKASLLSSYIKFGQSLIEFGQSLIEFGQSLIEFGQSLIEFGQSSGFMPDHL